MPQFSDDLWKDNTYITFGVGDNTSFISGAFVYTPQVRTIARNCCWNNYRILYLLRGSGVYKDENGVEIDLKAGSMIQRLPNVRHDLIRDDDGQWLEFALVLSSDLFKAMTALHIIDPERISFTPGVHSYTMGSLQQLIDTLKQGQQEESIQAALIEAQKLLLSLSQLDNKQGFDLITQKIEDSCKLLGCRLEQAVYMPDVANGVGLGYHNFRKIFKQIKGISPKEFRLRRRVDKARELLTHGQVSLQEISFALGYPDFASFAKQFKKVTGITPTNFRKG